MRRSLRALEREGFRHVFVLSSPEEIESVSIERQPLSNNLKHEHGPFDIIGDVHGCIKTLRALIVNIIQPAKNDKLIFVGDYVDRGPDSKGVISYVMELRLMGYNLVLLKGNHEDMMLQALPGTNKEANSTWLSNGGADSLLSWEISSMIS